MTTDETRMYLELLHGAMLYSKKNGKTGLEVSIAEALESAIEFIKELEDIKRFDAKKIEITGGREE